MSKEQQIGLYSRLEVSMWLSAVTVNIEAYRQHAIECWQFLNPRVTLWLDQKERPKSLSCLGTQSEVGGGRIGLHVSWHCGHLRS